MWLVARNDWCWICRVVKGQPYSVVTDGWQNFTNYPITKDTLTFLSKYSDEFLVHGVKVEAMWNSRGSRCIISRVLPVAVTYAEGVRSLEDMELVKNLGKGKVDLTIGSALDCFGGMA